MDDKFAVLMEAGEQVRFYASLLATPNTSEEVQKLCNKYLERYLLAMEAAVDKDMDKLREVYSKIKLTSEQENHIFS